MPDVTSDPTPVSLLKKLQVPVLPAEDVWRRFVKLYTPLLFMWARRVGASEQEAPDLVQDVFLALAQEMSGFRHDPRRRFRGWLWTVLLNKWRDQLRHQAGQPVHAGLEHLETLTVPDNVEEVAEEQYRASLVVRALELMEAELPAVEFRACQEYIVKGRPAAEVAHEQGLTVNQIYLVKSRILRRLRAELDGLLD